MKGDFGVRLNVVTSTEWEFSGDWVPKVGLWLTYPTVTDSEFMC